MTRRSLPFAALLALPLLLTGCDLLGLEPASAIAARKEAEGKAVGGACRHAGRAIEDCYALNKRAEKAAVFAGWREMNDYMRENKIEVVKPEALLEAGVSAKQPGTDEDSLDGDKPAAKTSKKASAKH